MAAASDSALARIWSAARPASSRRRFGSHRQPRRPGVPFRRTAPGWPIPGWRRFRGAPGPSGSRPCARQRTRRTGGGEQRKDPDHRDRYSDCVAHRAPQSCSRVPAPWYGARADPCGEGLGAPGAAYRCADGGPPANRSAAPARPPVVPAAVTEPLAARPRDRRPWCRRPLGRARRATPRIAAPAGVLPVVLPATAPLMGAPPAGPGQAGGHQPLRHQARDRDKRQLPRHRRVAGAPHQQPMPPPSLPA